MCYSAFTYTTIKNVLSNVRLHTAQNKGTHVQCHTAGNIPNTRYIR